ncbi:hypothetical protein [Paenibacillus qinlingensis]|nr:hypothetical protein [Paenibacillus qinlingensis]
MWILKESHIQIKEDEFDPNLLNPLIDLKQLMPLNDLIDKYSGS